MGRWHVSWPQSALGWEQNGEAAGEAWHGLGCGVRVLGAGPELGGALSVTPPYGGHRSDLGVGRGLRERRPPPSALVLEGGGRFSQLFVSGIAAHHLHPNI